MMNMEKRTIKTKDPSSISLIGKVYGLFVCEEKKIKKSVECSMNVFYNIHTIECTYSSLPAY